MELSTPSRQSKDSTMVILALKQARMTEISEQNEGFRFCKKGEPATVPLKMDHKFVRFIDEHVRFIYEHVRIFDDPFPVLSSRSSQLWSMLILFFLY